MLGKRRGDAADDHGRRAVGGRADREAGLDATDCACFQIVGVVVGERGIAPISRTSASSNRGQ